MWGVSKSWQHAASVGVESVVKSKSPLAPISPSRHSARPSRTSLFSNRCHHLETSGFDVRHPRRVSFLH